MPYFVLDWQILHLDKCSVDDSKTGHSLDFQVICASNGQVNETFQNSVKLQEKVQSTGIGKITRFNKFLT